MQKTSISRRDFVAATVGIAGASAFARTLLVASPAFAAPLIRRNIGGLTANSPVIQSYRAAITKMKALPFDNPLSWTYQAAIHGTKRTENFPGWNSCQHSNGTNTFFWSWHRMYLYWFERIIRKMSDNASFAMPFWDWSSPSQRKLPSMFRDPASELFVSQRARAINDGSGSLPASHVTYARPFTIVSFSSASFGVEQSPHNPIHVDVGGGPAGWMWNPSTAAQDPIFWLHHANIDRLWNLWLAQGGGRKSPVASVNWRNRKFTFFNEAGQQIEMKGCEILAAAQQLNYTYEGEPSPVSESCPLRVSGIDLSKWAKVKPYVPPWEPITLGNDRVTAKIDIGSEQASLAAAARSNAETLFLEIEGVEAEQQPGVVWEVYLGASASDLARGSESPAYIGNIALFGSGIREGGHHEFTPAHFSFPIDRAVQAGLKAGQTDLQLTFVPTGILIDGKPSSPEVAAKVTIGKVSIVTETPPEEEKQ